ncbi:MAG: CcdB family protein [Hyphomonadaceae bacterium]
MAQFDVYRNPILAARASAPYVVSLQSDLIPLRETVVVAPLVRKGDPGAGAKLQRAILVNSEPYVVLFQAMSAVRVNGLGDPIARAPELRDHMMTAIDFIFLGF